MQQQHLPKNNNYKEYNNKEMNRRNQYLIEQSFNPNDYQTIQQLDQFYYTNFIRMKDLVDDRTIRIANLQSLIAIDLVSNTQLLLAQKNNALAKKQGLRYWISKLNCVPYQCPNYPGIVIKLDKMCFIIGRCKEIPNLYVRIAAFRKKSFQMFHENIFLVHVYEWDNQEQLSPLQQCSAVLQQQQQSQQIQVEQVGQQQVSRQQNEQRENVQEDQQIQNNNQMFDDDGYFSISSTSNLDDFHLNNNKQKDNCKEQESQLPTNKNTSLTNPQDLLIQHLSTTNQNSKIKSGNIFVDQQIKMEDQQQHQQQSDEINHYTTITATQSLEEIYINNNNNNNSNNNNQQNSTMVLENVQTRTQLKIEIQEPQQQSNSNNINTINNNNQQNQTNIIDSPKIYQPIFQPSSENYMNQNYLNQQNSLLNQIQQQTQLIILLQQQLQQKNREIEQQKQIYLSKIKIRDDKITFLHSQELNYETIISDLLITSSNNNNNNNNNMNI